MLFWVGVVILAIGVVLFLWKVIAWLNMTDVNDSYTAGWIAVAVFVVPVSGLVLIYIAPHVQFHT